MQGQEQPAGQEAHGDRADPDEGQSRQQLPTLSGEEVMQSQEQPASQELISRQADAGDSRQLARKRSRDPDMHTHANSLHPYITRSRGGVPPFSKAICRGDSLFEASLQ